MAAGVDPPGPLMLASFLHHLHAPEHLGLLKLGRTSSTVFPSDGKAYELMAQCCSFTLFPVLYLHISNYSSFSS